MPAATSPATATASISSSTSSTSAVAPPLDNILQQVAILATGNATSAGGLAFLDSLVQADPQLQLLVEEVHGHRGSQSTKVTTPGSAWHSMLPPSRWASAWAMCSPRPEPLCWWAPGAR